MNRDDIVAVVLASVIAAMLMFVMYKIACKTKSRRDGEWRREWETLGWPIAFLGQHSIVARMLSDFCSAAGVHFRVLSAPQEIRSGELLVWHISTATSEELSAAFGFLCSQTGQVILLARRSQLRALASLSGRVATLTYPFIGSFHSQLICEAKRLKSASA